MKRIDLGIRIHNSNHERDRLGFTKKMRVRIGLDGFLQIQFLNLKSQHHCCQQQGRS